jgi:hypothetical protein
MDEQFMATHILDRITSVRNDMPAGTAELQGRLKETAVLLDRWSHSIISRLESLERVHEQDQQKIRTLTQKLKETKR